MGFWDLIKTAIKDRGVIDLFTKKSKTSDLM
jgi:hypothetical protein